jgi:hypothetical protein
MDLQTMASGEFLSGFVASGFADGAEGSAAHPADAVSNAEPMMTDRIIFLIQ